MLKSASEIQFCNRHATAYEISSPPRVCVTIPFTLPFPCPCPVPSCLPSSVAFPYHPVFPSHFQFRSYCPANPPHPRHWNLHDLAKMPPSTTQQCGTQPVVIIIILVDYRIPNQFSKGQKVPWFVQVTVTASPPFGGTEIDYPRNTLPLAVKCLEGTKSWAHFQI